MKPIKQINSVKHLNSDNSFKCLKCDSLFTEHYYCSNCKCPERIIQPMIPSPTSSFSSEELAELTECIERANELLLSLASDRGSENLRSIQKEFKKLSNSYVLVKLKCKENCIEPIQGKMIDAGLDFIILETEVKNVVFIPFQRILLVKHIDTEITSRQLSNELINIDSRLRYSLMLHFGEVVSKSPFLLNLFFGLKLYQLIESYIGCFVYVRAENIEKEQEGKLYKVNPHRIEIDISEKVVDVDFDELCYLEIEREKLGKDNLQYYDSLKRNK